MKVHILILNVFILFVGNLFAQGNFEFVYQDTLNTLGYSTFQDNQGFFVTIGSTSTQNYSGLDAMIMKYKDEDDVIVQKFHKNDSTSQYTFGFLKSNGNYFVAGEIDDDVDNISKNLYICEISQDLIILQEKIYPVPEIYNQLVLTDLYLNNDSTVIIVGYLDDPAPGWLRDLYIAKLNTQGILLDTLISSQFQADFFGEILDKIDNSGYYLIGDFGYASLLKIDNDLDLTGYIPMSGYFYHGAIGARWLSDGHIVMGSLANQEFPGADYDLHMWVTDTNLVPLKDTVIFDEGWNFLPAFSGLDFLDENNIWVVTYPEWVNTPTTEEWGRIYIFNAELEVKGAKYFGESTPRYLYSVKALNDGGCIITGIVYDENSNTFHDVYIKKVMLNDIITNAEDTPDQYDYDVLLYPNPVQYELRIETYRRNLYVELCDLDGNCVVPAKKLCVPNSFINTSNLKQGTYIYKISENGKAIQTGKIIKK
jgi:hypothetical protein